MNRHTQWLHREINELGKSSFMAGISLTLVHVLLKMISPELAGDLMDPAVWGAVIGTDYMRRKTHGRN